MATIHVEIETVWLDGSGVAGTYRVYGHHISVVHCGDRSSGYEPKVAVHNVREHGHRGGRERGTCRSAIRLCVARVNAAMAEVWGAGREYIEEAA
jgi:hypothetical protein